MPGHRVRTHRRSMRWPRRRARETRAERSRLACDDIDAGAGLVAAPAAPITTPDAAFRDPVPGVQSDRAAARAVCDPLVRAVVHRRHPDRLALLPLSRGPLALARRA